MTNYFEALAQQQMVAATKAKHRAAEKRTAAKVVKSERDAPMKPSALEQDQIDKNAQLKIWRTYHREEINAVLNGPHGDDFRKLRHVVKQLSLHGLFELVDHVRSLSWLGEASLQTRQVVLAMIAKAIIQLHEIHGYPPINDSLPGEKPTAFEIIRNDLKVLT